jgi:hypothetical protein
VRKLFEIFGGQWQNGSSVRGALLLF